MVRKVDVFCNVTFVSGTRTDQIESAYARAINKSRASTDSPSTHSRKPSTKTMAGREI
jgi:hypothetical protein